MQDQKYIPFDVSVISEEVVEILLIDGTTDHALLDEIARENARRPEILRLMLNHPNTPEGTRAFAAQTLNLPVPAEPAALQEEDDAFETGKREKTQSLLQRVQHLKMGEKIQLAFKGSREIRSILLRDPNQEIMLAVINNPKITESEIELLSKQKTTSVDLLREIAKKKEWIRAYPIVHALVSNPKVPIGIALKHIHTIRTKDLAQIEKDRNISEAVRANAKKLREARKK